MSKKILVVEDDQDILQLIIFHLQADGFATLTAVNGIRGLEAAKEQLPDMILLDLMLPGMDGLEVCKSLKREPKTENIPIVMLTAKGEEIDRIVGFELGADDYITKPFSPREMILRLRAILRRYETERPTASKLSFGNLEIDLDSHRVRLNKEQVYLTVTEFNLLLELLENKGRVRSRNQLLDRVWGYQFDGYARTVDTHIRRLRQKIGPYADAIETVRGIGYRFKDTE